MMKKYSTEKGRTAMEMLFVLILLGVVASSVYSLIANVFMRRAHTETIFQVQNLVDDIKRKFAWRGPSSSGGYTVSGSGGIGQYLSDEKIIKHYNEGYIPSKAGVQIGFASDSSSFTIKLDNSPREFCVVVLTHSWGNELIDWSISSSSSASWQRSLNQKLPMKVNAAQTSCNADTKNIWLKFK